MGGDDGAHPSEIGRNTVAPDRPHRGHLARLSGSLGSPNGGRQQRGLQRRTDAHNYRIRDLAEIVAGVVPGCKIDFADGAGPDTRNYRVSCEKIKRVLPAFKPQWDARKGAEQLYAAYRSGGLALDEFEDPAISGSLTSTSCCRKASSPAICAAPAKWKRERPPSIDRRLSFAARSRETSAGAASSSDFARLPAPRARGNELFAGR